MYHYIFFDLDGTLTDSKEGILNSLRYAFDKLGEPVPPESTLIKFIGPPLQDSFAEFCGFSAERAAEAIAAFRERYEPVGKFENMAAPGMADLCARLKARGYVLALASSKPESLCVPICEKFGFTPSLAVVTGSPPAGLRCRNPRCPAWQKQRCRVPLGRRGRRGSPRYRCPDRSR